MAESATLNVRMDADTKDAFTSFCDEIGMSASSLMNVFAKTVVRNQAIPFSVTTRTSVPATASYARIFPQTEDELEEMLSQSASTPLSECITMNEGVANIKERMGW